MLTGMTDEDWDVVLRGSAPRGPGAATRVETTASSSRRCTISLFTTSHGGPCLRSMALGTLCGSASASEPGGGVEAFFEALAAISRTAHRVQTFHSPSCGRTPRAAGAKGGSRARRSGGRGAAFPPRSTSRPTSRPAARLRADRGSGERQPDVRGPARPRSGHQAARRRRR